MLLGLNHVTYAVSSLDKSFEFYTQVLGMKPKAKWKKGAYLQLGDLWFCLNVDDTQASSDYSHVAFDISQNDFLEFKNKLEYNNVKIWHENTSEGDSLYILDPDKHKLEIHVGSLTSRLNSLKKETFEELVLYE